MLAKLLSGLLLILTIVVGWNIFIVGSFTSKQQKPESAATSSALEDPLLHPTSQIDTITRLSLMPALSLPAPLIAVVVENHQDARPFQKGLDRAVLISEFLVEGLISRFVALFSVTDLPESIGPVRSLRPYFIDALQPWTSLFLYAGGSPDALEQIKKNGIPHINGLFLPEDFIRNTSIAEPHNLFLGKNAVLHLIKTSPLTSNAPFSFARGPLISDQQTQKISVNFFNPDHNVTFTYNPLTASYKRQNGTVTTDAVPNNILILEAPIRTIMEYGRLDIPIQGTGSLLLFQSGKVAPGMWQKNAPGDPFVFVDQTDKPLPFANGQIWMMVLETLDRVKWE